MLQLIVAMAHASCGTRALVATLRSAAQLSGIEAELSHALANLIEELDSPTHPGGVIETSDVYDLFLRSAMSNGNFLPKRMEDAAEWFERLLAGLRTMGGVGRADAVAWEHAMTCGTCSHVVRTKDNAPLLQVEFDPEWPVGTLQELINRTVEPEPECMVGGNQYRCKNCDENEKVLGDATRQRVFTVLPDLLCIHLMRFTNRLRKNATPVEYGEWLRIPLGGKTLLYRRIAAVYHEGGALAGGHFVTYVTGADGLETKLSDESVGPPADRVADTDHSQGYVIAYKRFEAPAPTSPAVSVHAEDQSAPTGPTNADAAVEGDVAGQQQVIAAPRGARVCHLCVEHVRHVRNLRIVTRAPSDDASTYHARGTCVRVRMRVPIFMSYLYKDIYRYILYLYTHTHT
jgi:hypothetical protein